MSKKGITGCIIDTVMETVEKIHIKNPCLITSFLIYEILDAYNIKSEIKSGLITDYQLSELARHCWIVTGDSIVDYMNYFEPLTEYIVFDHGAGPEKIPFVRDDILGIKTMVKNFIADPISYWQKSPIEILEMRNNIWSNIRSVYPLVGYPSSFNDLISHGNIDEVKSALKQGLIPIINDEIKPILENKIDIMKLLMGFDINSRESQWAYNFIKDPLLDHNEIIGSVINIIETTINKFNLKTPNITGTLLAHEILESFHIHTSIKVGPVPSDETCDYCWLTYEDTIMDPIGTDECQKYISPDASSPRHPEGFRYEGSVPWNVGMVVSSYLSGRDKFWDHRDLDFRTEVWNIVKSKYYDLHIDDDLIKHIIEAGTEQEIIEFALRCPDIEFKDHISPVIYAAIVGRKNILKILFKYGFNKSMDKISEDITHFARITHTDPVKIIEIFEEF